MREGAGERFDDLELNAWLAVAEVTDDTAEVAEQLAVAVRRRPGSRAGVAAHARRLRRGDRDAAPRAARALGLLVHRDPRRQGARLRADRRRPDRYLTLPDRGRRPYPGAHDPLPGRGRGDPRRRLDRGVVAGARPRDRDRTLDRRSRCSTATPSASPVTAPSTSSACSASTRPRRTTRRSRWAAMAPKPAPTRRRASPAARSVLEDDVEGRDRYGRRLAYVLVDGRRFNDELLALGYARLLVIEPNRAHRARCCARSWRRAERVLACGARADRGSGGAGYAVRWVRSLSRARPRVSRAWACDHPNSWHSSFIDAGSPRNP